MSKERLVATPLTDIAMKSISWLEKPLWQSSAFQLLSGAKGAGKGTYLASLASRTSNNGKNVLIISSEDSAEIDTKPRLIAAGADIRHCYLIKQSVALPGDVGELRDLAMSIGGVGLFIIDPVGNHIGTTKTGDDGEVRNAIAPLNQLADDLSCLLIGVRHPGKDRSRGALASILGSTAWIDTPRAVVMIAVDDEDPELRHIQVVAGNRSLNGSGRTFKIKAIPVAGLDEPITIAVEDGESSKSVDDLLAALPGKGTKTGGAVELILDILEDEGAQESDSLDARIHNETGLSVGTIRNARTKLKDAGLIKVLPEKDQDGKILRWKASRTQAPRAA